MPTESAISSDSAGSLAGAITASCEPTENALRFSCAATVENEQSVTFRFWPTGNSSETIIFTSDQKTSEHSFHPYLMWAETAYSWEVEGQSDGAKASGSWHTTSLPENAQVTYEIEGTSSAEYVLFVSPCSEFVLIGSTEGQTVWYQAMDGGTGERIANVSWTEDHTFLANTTSRLVEYDAQGNEILVLKQGEDYEHDIHHEAYRKDGLTYVLYRFPVYVEGVLDAVEEGFYVFDGNTQIGDVRLTDSFGPEDRVDSTNPDYTDYSHSNSLSVDDVGDVIVSFRHQSSIAKIVGNPNSDNFGDWIWGLQGLSSDAGPGFPNDFSIVAPEGVVADFEQQHHAHFLPDGSLSLFDNRSISSEPARVLRIALDEVSRTASIEQAYLLPDDCSFAGGSAHTAAGNPIGTCAPTREAFEFDALSAEQVWYAQMTCVPVVGYLGNGFFIPRVIPWQKP